ncbi:MAG: helix-turn-helix transcriptional regulator [Firmicutes bacterium]|nr:helix-turn-helix transcriptional regulator [Bacillota bacterium]
MYIINLNVNNPKKGGLSMPELHKELGKRVKANRKNKNLSTPDLAKQLNISTGLLNNIENGRYDVFKLNLITKLTKVLNLPLSELLDISTIDVEKLDSCSEILISKTIDNPKNKDIINFHLNKLIKNYLETLLVYDLDHGTIEMITDNLIHELKLIRNLKNK